jgi:hypothetical protein
MKVVNAYLAQKADSSAADIEAKIEALIDALRGKGITPVTKQDVELLEAAEQEEARARKTWDFKYTSDDKMIEVISGRKAAR